MEDNKQHRVRVKIGSHEFEAEGDKATVEEQLRRFFELVDKSPAPAQTTETLQKPPVLPSGEAGTDSEVLSRVFKDERGIVSLRVLPKTKSYVADSLLLLLYGYRALKQENEVLGGHLMKAGKQSGLQIDRVDRVLSLYGEYYNRGGTRKGARYGLNNRGIEKAKELMNTMFD